MVRELRREYRMVLVVIVAKYGRCVPGEVATDVLRVLAQDSLAKSLVVTAAE